MEVYRILLLLILAILGAIPLAFGQQYKVRNELPGFAYVEHELDELGEFKIGVYRHWIRSNNEAPVVSHTIQLMRLKIGSAEQPIPKIVQDGFKVFFDGKAVPLSWNLRMIEGFAKAEFSDRAVDKVREIKIQFYGKDMGSFRFDPANKKIVELSPQRTISRFTFRDILQRGQSAVDDFRKTGELVKIGSKTASRVDLHTHLKV